jgi:glycerol uptake facilitator-like aquaporin
VLTSAVKPSVLVYEFFGTALMIYAYNLGQYDLRGFAYFIAWLLTYHVSGAEFNHGVTLATFFVERDWTKGKALGFTLLAQLLGSLFGVFLVLILLSDQGSYVLKPMDLSVSKVMFVSALGEIYWGRLLMFETLLTFVFTVIYLVLRYESAMKKVDRMVKGIAACFTLTVCLQMSAGSGGALNPCIGIA